MSTKQISVPPSTNKRKLDQIETSKEVLAKRRRTQEDLTEQVHADQAPVIEILYKTNDIYLHIDGEYSLTVEKLVPEQYPEFLKPDTKFVNSRQQEPKRKLKFCHQLDYATSGILCLAFTKKSCGSIGQCFQDRLTNKLYLALCMGHVQYDISKPISVSSYIGTDTEDATGFKMKNFDTQTGDARIAESDIYVIAHGTYKGTPVTKVLLKPKSGRRHQLRLHMLKLGNPILGDFTYSTTKELLVPRMCLHAWQLYLPIKKTTPLTIVTADPFTSMMEQVTEIQSLQTIADLLMKPKK